MVAKDGITQLMQFHKLLLTLFLEKGSGEACHFLFVLCI